MNPEPPRVPGFKIRPDGDERKQVVAFAADNDVPSGDGFYRDDGYRYQSTDKARVYTREKVPPAGYSAEPDPPPYDVAAGILRDTPTLPYSEFLTRANKLTIEPQSYADLESPYTIDEPEGRQSIAAVARVHYVHAIRFVNIDNALDMRPRTPVPADWKIYYDPELRTKALDRAMWDVAFEHMHERGKAAGSPFVSVAANEAALLRSTDWSANSIVFGSAETKRAPHIVHLRIPECMLLSSDNSRMEEYLKVQKGDISPVLLFKRETEQLFLGDDLTRYVEYSRDNPYRPEDRELFVGDI